MVSENLPSEWAAPDLADYPDWVQVVQNLERSLAETKAELQQERSQRIALTAKLQQLTQACDAAAQSSTAELAWGLQPYHRAVENSPNPIFAIDQHGTIQDWNLACEQFYQYDRLLDSPMPSSFLLRQRLLAPRLSDI